MRCSGIAYIPSVSDVWQSGVIADLQPGGPLWSLPNIRWVIGFRILFHARLYYPVFAVLFLDFGLSMQDYALLGALWAASIVLFEVPSGALADSLGRRPLLIGAALCLIVEMALLAWAPTGDRELVLLLFALSRLCSGLGEALASGADEALSYETLVAAGIAERWPQVLALQMRLQSMAFILSMSLGAFLYDAGALNAFFEGLQLGLHISADQARRLPLLGGVLMGCGALYCAVQTREQRTFNLPTAALLRQVHANVVRAFWWTVRQPLALVLLVAGMALDSVARTLVTMASEYYRLIGFPEASYGVIGSAMALLGVFLPGLWRFMLASGGAIRNGCLMGAMLLAGLFGLACMRSAAGLLPMALVFAVMMGTGFFVSRYLNLIVPESMRATVLSLRSLAQYLAYGLCGLWYAASAQILYADAHAPQVFERMLGHFPGYTAIWFLCILLLGARQRPDWKSLQRSS